MTKVYDGDEIIGEVDYNENLDYWNGSNWQNGGTGEHKGLTQLEDGRYVLVIGSDWQGVRDYGIIINKAQAVQEILESDNQELFEEFKELKEEYDKTILQEKKQVLVK